MSDTLIDVSTEDLAVAEAAFRSALRTGDLGGLRVLGYGELSTVVAIDTAAGSYACKRLPPFEGLLRFESYRGLFEEYLERLEAAGLNVLPSALRALDPGGGSLVAYCIQPIVEADRLGPKVLAGLDSEAAAAHFASLLDQVLGTVEPTVGLDAQLANWLLRDDGWAYLDVTTPLLRDTAGRDRLDADLYLAMLPFALRAIVRRFLLHGITRTYFEPRRVVMDFLANLHKERLERHLPAFLEIANRHLEPPFTAREVRAYYASDARLWSALLALRRADRFWQRRVRRRPYPFLLPGRINR